MEQDPKRSIDAAFARCWDAMPDLATALRLPAALIGPPSDAERLEQREREFAAAVEVSQRRVLRAFGF